MATKKDQTDKKQKKGFPLIAGIGIGCLVVLIAIGVGFSVAGKIIFSKFGQKAVEEGIKKGIEANTGVSIDNSNDNIVFKDKKTGEEVKVGNQSIPADFPKDFPVYPGSKPTGTLSQGKADGKGFWLLLETNDIATKVTSYYEENLKTKNWDVEDTVSFGDAMTFKVTKGNLSGTVVISGDKDAKKTTILITLTPGEASKPATESEGQ